MKTLKDIIALRGSRFIDEAKNSAYTEFWQGYFDGWDDAYIDLKEILEQNKFNLNVPVTAVGETNADHIRSMTDEALADFLIELADDGNLLIRDWLKQTYREATP